MEPGGVPREQVAGWRRSPEEEAREQSGPRRRAQRGRTVSSGFWARQLCSEATGEPFPWPAGSRLGRPPARACRCNTLVAQGPGA